jgi:hypothetical protein
MAVALGTVALVAAPGENSAGVTLATAAAAPAPKRGMRRWRQGVELMARDAAPSGAVEAKLTWFCGS